MTDQATNTIAINDDVAIQELVIQLEDLNQVVNQLVKLREDNLFRFVSKQSRNELLQTLMAKSGAVEDAAKAAFRSLKKNKRERLPENVADFLLINRRDLAIAAAPEVTGVPEIAEND